jgi:hypothetical protein
LGRVGTDDIAKVVVFLASDRRLRVGSEHHGRRRLHAARAQIDHMLLTSSAAA